MDVNLAFLPPYSALKNPGSSVLSILAHRHNNPVDYLNEWEAYPEIWTK